MATQIETVHISSSNASARNHHGHFTAKLGAHLHHVSAVELAAASIPNTFHSVRASEKLLLNIGGSDLNVTVAAGCYTSSTILSALKSALETADASVTYTVTYSQTTFRLTIARSTGTFTIRAGSARVARVLGFPQTAGSAAAAVTATDPAALGVNCVILASRALRNPLLGERSGCFSLHLTEGAGGVTNFASNKDYRCLIQFQSPIRLLSEIDIMLQSVHVQDGLLDPDGHPMDLTLRISHQPI